MTIDREFARDLAGLGLAMLVGLLLRSLAIGHEALWADEALTYVLAQAPPFALAEAPIDPTGPFYYWLHQLFIADGTGAAGGRAISLVAGVLAIPAAYWLGRATVGRVGGAFAAWWVAVSAPLVDYSQEARAYAVLVLLVTLSALMLLGALRASGGRRRWLLTGFGVTLVVALYTHFVALFWAGPALFILLFESRRGGDRGAWREALATMVMIMIAAIPEARRVWRYATENNAFHWLAQLDPGGFLALLASQWLPLGGMILLVAAALLMIGLAVRGRRGLVAAAGRDPAAAMVIGALALQPVALWLFGFFLLPVLMVRTMLPSLPAAGIVIAALIGTLRAPWRMPFGIALVAAALVATVSGGLVRSKEPWNGARAVLAAGGAPAPVVACPFWKVPALMAATRGLGAGPLVTKLNGRMLLIEERLGAEPRWERLFYTRAYASLLAPALGVARPVERGEAVAANSLWLVASECSPEEKEAIGRWAGPYQVVQRWSEEGRLDHAGIAIERWQLARPRTLPVRVAR